MACACCGKFWFGEEEVLAVTDNVPKTPKSSAPLATPGGAVEDEMGPPGLASGTEPEPEPEPSLPVPAMGEADLGADDKPNTMTMI